MKDKYCCGFAYETEEELKQLLSIDEYLDVTFGKRNNQWIPEFSWSSEGNDELQTSLGMEVYVRRKAEGLTQRELAKKLGIAVETINKIENGHEKLSSKVKSKINDYLKADD